MARSQQSAARKPATKFPNLRKKLELSKTRAKVRTTNIRRGGGRAG